MEQATDSENDYAKLDDTELFTERRRARERLERLPAHHADRARLAEQFAALTREFDRRARSAWQAS
jgi:hypothetical protein